MRCDCDGNDKPAGWERGRGSFLQSASYSKRKLLDNHYRWWSEMWGEGGPYCITSITSTLMLLKNQLIYSFFPPLISTQPLKRLRQNYANVILFYGIFAFVQINLICCFTPALLQAISTHYVGLDNYVPTQGYGLKKASWDYITPR